MATNKDIYEFALRWYKKYLSPSTTTQEVEDGFSDECFSLNFEMDCGKAFEAAFPDTNALNDHEVLNNLIEMVKDVSLLGSAIFSKWRYVTHWDEADLLAPQYRKWFIIAFRRLAELTAENGISPYNFKGIAQKVQII